MFISFSFRRCDVHTLFHRNSLCPIHIVCGWSLGEFLKPIIQVFTAESMDGYMDLELLVWLPANWERMLRFEAAQPCANNR